MAESPCGSKTQGAAHTEKRYERPFLMPFIADKKDFQGENLSWKCQCQLIPEPKAYAYIGLDLEPKKSGITNWESVFYPPLLSV
mgnify:CR=1 FL=1